MSKFNKKTVVKKVIPNTRNRAGGLAFSMSPEMELIHAVLTTFLDDKYYESGGERLARIQSLIGQVNPRFVANLAVVARKEFHLRSVSHVLIGELSKIHSGDDLVKRTIVAAAERPDDLMEIASYVGLPLTKQIKRGIRNAILKFDRYTLAKYRGEGKDISLVDLFNLTHPKVEFANKEQKKAWKDLMTGKLTNMETWESKISNSEDEEEKAENWKELVLEGKLGYMALLRNLNNLLKNDVGDKVIKAACKQLTDKEKIKKSKQLPFRFYTAFQNVNGNRLLSDAISEAMDVSVANAPEFKGNTLIAVDASGSMTYTNSDGKPAIEIASIFAAALLKNNTGADVILFDDKAYEINLSGRTPVIDLAGKIQSKAQGGGTNTSSVFQYAIASKKKYDRIIILSDNESWQESRWSGSGTQTALEAYKNAIKADPTVFAVDIAGYGTSDVKGKKVFHFTGWSDRILDFMGKVEQGDSLVEYVEEYVI